MTPRKNITRGAQTPPAATEPRDAQSFFGFTHKPFALSPDPKFLYRSHTHGAAFDMLVEGIRQLDGLLVLTGDIGTGKTTLHRAILQTLESASVSAVLADPLASREDLLKTLLIEFGVISLPELRSGRLQGASRAELNFLLRDFLRSLGQTETAAVAVIDEAQNLSSELWEEIRILSDLHSETTRLHVLLVGLPQLSARLKQSDLQGIDQRISTRCALEPLNRQEVAGFIAHRLDVATARRACQFSDDALDAVFRITGGVPRLISLLCDRALHEASRRRITVVNGEVIDAAHAPLAASIARPGVDPVPYAGVKADEFAGQVNEWLNNLERVVDRTPKAPLDLAAPKRAREWSKPHIPLLKRLLP
jgi:general secretion pathway protein A